MTQYRKLTPNQRKNWFKIDVSLQDKSSKGIETVFNGAMAAVEWLSVNASGRWGFDLMETDPIIIFRLELQEDRDLLLLHWSSL